MESKNENSKDYPPPRRDRKNVAANRLDWDEYGPGSDHPNSEKEEVRPSVSRRRDRIRQRVLAAARRVPIEGIVVGWWLIWMIVILFAAIASNAGVITLSAQLQLTMAALLAEMAMIIPT